MNYCKIIPTVTVNGEEKESNLFKELLKLTGSRNTTKKIYYNLKDLEIGGMFKNLKRDENNEPTILSLQKQVNLSKLIGTDIIINSMNNTYKDLTFTDIEEAANELRAVNNSTLIDSGVAMILQKHFENNKPVFSIKAVASSDAEKLNKEALKEAYVYNKLLQILKENNIAVGALYEVDKRLNSLGTLDANTARTLANGMIEAIRLADGMEHELLPEEFSHLFLRAVEDDVLRDRLLKVVSSELMHREILGEDYDAVAKDCNYDFDKITEEVAGRLLAKHLLNNTPIPNKSYKTLLKRFIDKVKKIIGKIDEGDIKETLNKADELYSKVADKILKGEYNRRLNINRIFNTERMNHINSKVLDLKEVLQYTIQNEIRRLKIYSGRNESFDQHQRELLTDLQTDLAFNEYMHGITTYIEDALKHLLDIKDKKLDTIEKDLNEGKVSKVASAIITIDDYVKAYLISIDNINKQATLLKFEGNPELNEKLGDITNETLKLISDITNINNHLKYQTVKQIFEPILGKGITYRYGKNKGRVLTLDEILECAESDISALDSLFMSLASSGDVLLSAISKMVNDQRSKGRHKAIKIMDRIKTLQFNLEKAGFADLDWMIERYDDGTKTGEYIKEYNYPQFYKDLQDIAKEVYEKNKNLTLNEQEDLVDKAQKIYRLQHGKYVKGKFFLTSSKYKSKIFEEVCKDARIDYYNGIMAIKQDLDKHMPHARVYRTVQLRITIAERLREGGVFKGSASNIYDGIKSFFNVRTDDIGYDKKEDTKNVLKDFDGKRVMTLPTYFVDKLENLNEVTTDVSSSMMAYTSMACDYIEMSDIIDLLELARSFIHERKVKETSGNAQMQESFRVMGKEIKNPLYKTQSRIVSKIDDYFEGTVYRHFKKDEGSITILGKKLSYAKMADTLNSFASFSCLSLSPLSGAVNVNTGKIMGDLEALGGEFFGVKNIWNADKYYFSNIAEYIGEIGKRNKTSMLSLIDKTFNVLMDFDRDALDAEMTKKNYLNKILNKSNFFFMMRAGEHYVHLRTACAYFDNYKVLDDRGNETCLLEAFTKKIDNNGIATLAIKDGYRKMDGTAFTELDFINIEGVIRGLNHGMHGAYDTASSPAIQRYAIGRLAMLFRKWIPEAVNKRWGKESVNLELGTETLKGYQRVFYRFLIDCIKNTRAIPMIIKNLNKAEQRAIIKALAENMVFILTFLLTGLFKDDDDDDDALEGRSKFMKSIEYLLYREKNEIGILTNPYMTLTEGWNLINTPIVAKSFIETAGHVLNPFSWGDKIEAGRYRGLYKIVRDLMKLFGLDNIYRAVDINDSLRGTKSQGMIGLSRNDINK